MGRRALKKSTNLKKLESSFDISNQKMEEMEKNVIKNQEKFDCYYRKLAIYKKAPEPLPLCIIDQKRAMWFIEIKPKEFFKIGGLFICQNDKDRFNFRTCSNPAIPFGIAPCIFYKNLSCCAEYITDIIPDTKVESISISEEKLCDHSKDDCINYQKLDIKPIDESEESEEAKCFVCGMPATKQFKLKNINRFVCERHAKFHGCKVLPSILAICDMLKFQTNCLGYTTNEDE